MGFLIVLTVGGFLCSFIAALIGAFRGTSDRSTYGGANHDIIEPMYKYPPLNIDSSDRHEIPAKKTDSHFMEKVTYVGAMSKIWKDQD